MKILHLNNEKTWRGGERQTLLLAAALQHRGVGGAIACRPGGPLQQQAQSKTVNTLPIPANNLGAALTLIRVAGDFDLIHCHTGRGHSLAAFTASAHRKPFIVTRRVDFLPSQSWFNRRKYGGATRVVCISDFIAAQLRDWGVAPQKLVVIPSAVPPPAAAQSRAELRAKLDLPTDKKIVGNIAALVGHKAQATLLRAARQLCDRRSDVLFVVMGDGELKEDLLRLRAQLGLESQVRFLGHLPEAQQYLPAFDVFAMSSCMEGLGSIVLDAFNAGVPVAATAGGGLPELVRHEETGLLVPVGDARALADAINRLLDDLALGQGLCDRAKLKVTSDFSVTRMAERYQATYEDILRR
jgi:glycosyltransferase involved in cell wall biosynthesis